MLEVTPWYQGERMLWKAYYGGDVIALGKDMGLNASHLMCVAPRAVSLVFVGWRMHLPQTEIG